MTTKIAIRIVRGEYDAFVRAVPNEPRLPPSYDEFLKRGLEEDAKAIAQGHVLHEVTLHYKTFADYATNTGQQLSYTMMMAAAVAVAMANPKR